MKIGIVAHDKRFLSAEPLRQAVEADLVSYDNGHLGATANHRAVWTHLGGVTAPDEWAVVLEDDALPVDDFRVQAAKALSHSPTEVVSFYLGRQRPSHWQRRIISAVACADREDAHWIIADSQIFGVAVALPGRLISSMLEHTRRITAPLDDAIGQWCRTDGGPYGRAAAFTWPSLVDHADGPPVIKRRKDGQARPPGRVAWRTGVRDTWDRKRTVRL